MFGASAAGISALGALDQSNDVLAMCAAARASEADDIHAQSCVTIGSIVIPAALWAARRCDADDERLACAILAGYEAGTWLGVAIEGADRVYGGLWPSYFVAPFAAAATVAHFSGSSETIGEALAIASGHIAGDMPAPAEPTARWLSFAVAMQAGIRSAMFAQAGLRGDCSYLERRLARSFGTRVNGPAVNIDGQFALVQTDMKPFCMAFQLLSAAQAAQHAVKVDAGPIFAIRLRVPKQTLRMVDRPNPEPSVALTSGQLQIATAILRPELLYRRDREALLEDAEVRALMSRVTVEADARLSERYPEHWGASVEIDYESRHSFCAVDDPLGSRYQPLDAAALRHKLLHLALPPHFERELSQILSNMFARDSRSSELLTLFGETWRPVAPGSRPAILH